MADAFERTFAQFSTDPQWVASCPGILTQPESYRVIFDCGLGTDLSIGRVGGQKCPLRPPEGWRGATTRIAKLAILVASERLTVSILERADKTESRSAPITKGLA